MDLQHSGDERARFTARIPFFERPEVAEKLARMADQNGHSLAAEIRGAVRFWIQSWERNEA